MIMLRRHHRVPRAADAEPVSDRVNPGAIPPANEVIASGNDKGPERGGNGQEKRPEDGPNSSRRFRPGWWRRLLVWLAWSTAFVLAIASLVQFSTISRRSGEEFLDATREVRRTRDVLEKLADITSRLGDVESAARDFAISGTQSHLNPFYTAADAVPQKIAELKALLKSDPAQLKVLSEAEPLISKHLTVMKNMVELGSKHLFRAVGQRDLTDEGYTLMAHIRETLGKLENSQRGRLEQQQSKMGDAADHVALISLAGNIWATLLVLVCGIFAMRAVRERGKAQETLDRLLGSLPDAIVIVNAEGKIVSSNERTENLFGYTIKELQGQSLAMLVPERLRQMQRQYYSAQFSQRGGRTSARTIELSGLHKDGREFPIEISTKQLADKKGMLVTSAIRDVTQRKQTEQQVRRLNEELEQRAAELETSNKELEAFSYSVSHDLRSPLQNIDGFSQILLQDYANRLDVDGRDYLQRLRGSCQRMEEIIEALLALSNMTRMELQMQAVDLSALAQAVSAEFQRKDPNRLVDWVIAPGLTAHGDAKLLSVVLENLFGNAWKFTGQRPRARIEFGALPQDDGKRVYFVRDDGAGFDMARAGSLFTPFKRLHDQGEFRGTGIGLATVQRVIRRHRGKIWAEGIVNHGATFCFTLADRGPATNGQHDNSTHRN